MLQCGACAKDFEVYEVRCDNSSPTGFWCFHCDAIKPSHRHPPAVFGGNRTLWDLAGLRDLVGRRVRFLADDIPNVVPKGTVGIIVDDRAGKTDRTKVLVTFVRTDRTDLHDRHPWREVTLETHLSNLALSDDEPIRQAGP